MATQALQGSATIKFTPAGGTEIVHTLAVPLKEVEPTDPRTRFEWWSADLRNRNVVTVGGGVREIEATIRMDNQPDQVKQMLRVGLEENGTLTYQRTSGGTEFPAKLVAVVGAEAASVEPDRDRAGFGEYEARLRLRRVDGGDFDELVNP